MTNHIDIIREALEELSYSEATLNAQRMKLEADAALDALEAAMREPQPMGYERWLAIREGHFNAASEEYFNARPQLDNNHNRRIFYAGHCKGYDAAPPTQQADYTAGDMASAAAQGFRDGVASVTQQPQAEVGNSGFDHKTAADFLSGKTVSDEAVRKFVHAYAGRD